MRTLRQYTRDYAPLFSQYMIDINSFIVVVVVTIITRRLVVL